MKRSSKRPVCRVGVIGGSGVYDLSDLRDRREFRVKTPFGDPSGPVLTGEIGGVSCAFIPRHGPGHTFLPSEIPVRANIWALKSFSVERLVAVAAVGSLKEELPPRRFVFPDQIFDKTHRPSSFFGDGIVAHVAFARLICDEQAAAVHEAAQALGISSHKGGTYVCMEGPGFSTLAESLFHRSLGFSVIGMTAATEAKLAREAELCYSLIALVTDYDCWREGDEVSADRVVETMRANVADAQRLVARAIPAVAAMPRRCGCGSALAGAIVTDRKAVKPAVLKRLELIAGKYLKG